MTTDESAIRALIDAKAAALRAKDAKSMVAPYAEGATICLTATPLNSEEPFHLWHRVTLGLRKINGAWQVTHEHESVPFEMDGSFRASIGLQPV